MRHHLETSSYASKNLCLVINWVKQKLNKACFLHASFILSLQDTTAQKLNIMNKEYMHSQIYWMYENIEQYIVKL